MLLLCKERQRNEHTITHAYTVTVLIAIGVVIYVFKKANESPAKQNNQSFENQKLTFRHISRHVVSDSCEKVAWGVHASREEHPM